MRGAFLAASALVLALIGVTASQAPKSVDSARLAGADGDTSNWLMHGRTSDDHRFSPLKQINERVPRARRRNPRGERATDGKQVWPFDAGTGIMAPPITYTRDGVQYVSVMAGWGGPPPFKDLLKPDQVKAIQAYVLSRAKERASAPTK